MHGWIHSVSVECVIWDTTSKIIVDVPWGDVRAFSMLKFVA